MLAINGNINAYEGSNVYSKHYAKCMEALWKEFPTGRVELAYTDKHENLSVDGKMQRASGVWIYGRWSYVIDNQRVDVQYYEMQDNNDPKKLLPRQIYFNRSGVMTFTKGGGQEDLLYLAIFISPQCEKFEALKHLQNPLPYGNIDFKINDLVGKATAEVEQEGKKAKIVNFIYNEAPDEQLRVIAGSMYHIHNASSLNIMFVKKQLIAAATKTQQTIDDFKFDDFEEKTAIAKSIVQTALDLQILKKLPTQNLWQLKDFEGKTTAFLQLTKGQDMKKSLFDYCDNNEEALMKLKEFSEKYKERMSEINHIPA